MKQFFIRVLSWLYHRFTGWSLVVCKTTIHVRRTDPYAVVQGTVVEEKNSLDFEKLRAAKKILEEHL